MIVKLRDESMEDNQRSASRKEGAQRRAQHLLLPSFSPFLPSSSSISPALVSTRETHDVVLLKDVVLFVILLDELSDFRSRVERCSWPGRKHERARSDGGSGGDHGSVQG